MIDITIIGGGSVASACAELLSAAGFGVHPGFDFDEDGHGPIILGDAPGAPAIARRAVEAGRHLLVANPSLLSPDRLSLFYKARRPAQALHLWSTRRAHPGYRFTKGLIESDPTWQPRYLRVETLLTCTPALSLANWTLAESAAIAILLTAGKPVSVSARAAENPLRNANEFSAMAIDFGAMEAFLQLGLGEAVERRETLVAAAGRKVYIDELDPSTPVRLLTGDTASESARAARWLSAAPASHIETTRQQCLTFLDATLNPAHSAAEADLWTRSFAVLDAARQSQANAGAATPIEAAGAPPATILHHRAVA